MMAIAGGPINCSFLYQKNMSLSQKDGNSDVDTEDGTSS